MWKIFSKIGDKINEHFEKKKQEQEELERMRKEAEFQRIIQKEQEQRDNALLAVKRNLLEQAEKKQGIQRLRAISQAQRIGENTNPILSKLSEHTRKNMQRTEENKRRNQIIREEAKRMRLERLERTQNERILRMKYRGYIG